MERVLSEYNFVEKEEVCCSESCLEQYAQSKLKILNGSDDCHFIPQVYYVFENGDHKKGNQICKHVLRYESFTQEFSALMGRYGLDLTVPELGQHRSRRCDVVPTPLTVQLVKKFFSADYEAFQYWVLGRAVTCCWQRPSFSQFRLPFVAVGRRKEWKVVPFKCILDTVVVCACSSFFWL